MVTRLRRAGEAALHLFAGLRTLAIGFPRATPRGRRRLIRRWSSRLLRLLGVELRVSGYPQGLAAPRRLMLSNHVSWLDVFVINAIHPARFVAKAEIRRWPLVGRLVAGVGTLFIERSRRRDTHRMNRALCAAIEAGELVAVFPEGTTTDGSRMLRFHGSLLQSVIDAEGQVVPVAIRYRTPRGERSGAAAYDGDVSFLRSLWRIVAERRVIAEAIVLEPLAAAGRTRRELAADTQALIRTALGLTADAKGLGTRPGRRVAAR